MSKAQAKKGKKSRSSDGLIIVIGLIAVMVAIGLIALNGLSGATPVSQADGSASAGNAGAGLELCGGKPCPSQGSADAPVTMIEVSDYACSHCRDYNLGKASRLEDEYVKTGKVRYVSHIYAIRPETKPAAAAAWCAYEQGKYWEFHHQAFANQPQDRYPNTDDFLKWGSAIGVDQTQYAGCLNSGKYARDVSLSALEADRAGITGTPTFFIDGQVVQGDAPLEQFYNTIDAALAKAGK